MEDEVPTGTDVRSDDLEEPNDREVLGTVSPTSQQGGENDCTSEKSSNHETYYVFCDYKAQEDNQVAFFTTVLFKKNVKTDFFGLTVGFARRSRVDDIGAC